MRTVKFNGQDSYADFGLIRSNAEIGSPAPKTSTVDVEGADGVLDFTEYFGEVLYENRELTFDFQVPPQSSDTIEVITPIDTDSEIKDGGKGGFVIYGKTQHNLWVNPPAATKNGITYEAHEDGSISFTGSSTGETTISQVTSYAFEPGKTYTASVDRAVAEGNQMYFAVRNYHNGTGSHVASFGNDANGTTKTFTIPTNSDYVVLMIYSAAAGAIATGYFRVMINFGSTVDPWCPPGIHGVDSLTISQHGKNLANLQAPTENSEYLTARADLAKSRYIPGDTYAIRLWGELGEDRTSFLAYNSGGTSQLAVMDTEQDGAYSDVFTWKDRASGGYYKNTHLNIYMQPSSGTSASRIDRIQLERGNAVTDYEPPRIRETAIDLQGYTLDSSPDGTRDELRIDASGKVTLIKRTHRQTFDGTESFEKYQGNSNYFTLMLAGLEHDQGTNGSARFYSDCVRCLYGGQRAYNSALIGVSFTTTNNPEYVYINAPGATDLTTAKAWLADNPLTIVYKTLEAREIDLGYIPMEQFDTSFHAVFSRLKNAIHGKRCKIELSEDPNFYYIGRCEVDDWQTNEKIGEISVTCDCEPYKLRQAVTERIVNLTGTAKDVTFYNLKKRVVPVFDTGGATFTLKQGTKTFSANGSTWSNGDLYFEQGENVLTITGTGTLKVTYQERGL